ncbi:nitroreductase family protein [Paenibacillus silvisoli]|uniref:nitroreductase family protein n=1 Tax=Paenibacillus silvisoli TaxID=3110539 RepID=UPI0028049A58|nr:nitroreductase family protein [Paenibacillus silvisoli]
MLEDAVWAQDFSATSALIQNFMLLAWEKNIGTVWKTNPYIYDRSFCEELGLRSDEKIVGIIQLGYPAEEPEARQRVSAKELFTVF